MLLTKGTTEAGRFAVMKFHYSKRFPSRFDFIYNVYNDNKEWCGCIIYSGGANPAIGKPFNMIQGEVLELVRMALNGKQESTSKALGISLKLLKKDAPYCKLIVSYADKGQNHNGTIYQATNWIYIEDIKSSDINYFYKGRWTHSKTINEAFKRGSLKNKENLPKRRASGKHKYLYPLRKELRKQYNALALEYPKNKAPLV